MPQEDEDFPDVTFRINNPESLHSLIEASFRTLVDQGVAPQVLLGHLSMDQEAAGFVGIYDESEKAAIPGYVHSVLNDPLFCEINLDVPTVFLDDEGEQTSLELSFVYSMLAINTGMLEAVSAHADAIEHWLQELLMNTSLNARLETVMYSTKQKFHFQGLTHDRMASMDFETPTYLLEAPAFAQVEDFELPSVDISIEMPSTRKEFIAAVPKAQMIIEAALISLYLALRLSPSPDMNCSVDYSIFS